MLTIPQIKTIVTRICKKYGVKNAYLFGSYAKGQADSQSDIDLIIDKGDIHTYRDYFHFHQELEDSLGTKVDLTSEEGMFPKFFNLIKNDRIMLYGA